MRKLLMLGALAAPFCTFANTDIEPRVEVREPIVVTATGSPMPLSEVLAPTLVIEREEIERAQAGDIAEIIRSVAGFDMERFGGPGQLTQFRVRGGETDHVLLLIDGVRVNPATGAAVFQNLSPESIERIEIVKGPRATLYGSDAITGVVNIITREGDSGFGGHIRLGAHQTREISGRAAFAGERGSLSMQVEKLDSEGFAVLENVPIDRGYDRESIVLRGATRVSAVDVAVRANHASGTNEILSFNPATFATDLPNELDFSQQLFAVELSAKPLPSLDTQLTLSRADDDLETQNSPNRVRSTRPQVELSNVLQIGEAHRITLGGHHAREKAFIVANYCSTGVCSFLERRDVANVHLQTESAIGRHRLLLAAAWTDHDAFGDETTWNAEYGLDVLSQTRLILSAGTGFRAPNAFERFGDPFVGGNPDVGSETSINYEAGVRQGIGRGHVIDLRFFRNETDDLIAFDPATFTVNNIRNFENEGVDLSYRGRFPWFRVSLTALLQDPIDADSNQALLRRAERSASLKVVRDTRLYSLGLEVIASGERPDIDFQTFGPTTVPGYAIYNLTGGLQLSDVTRLEARWENVSDKIYQTVDGYVQERSAGYVSLRFNF